jgi:hypothetical protein
VDRTELVTIIAGAGTLLGAYWAMATVDLATGQVTRSAGAEVSASRFADFAPVVDTSDADYTIRSSDGDKTAEQQLTRFHLTKNRNDLRTSVGDTSLRAATTGFVSS